VLKPNISASTSTRDASTAGEAVALRAAGLLRDLRDLRTLQDEEQPRGQLRLGVAQTAIATVLCDVLPALAQKYPELEIVVQKGSSAQVFAKLDAAEVDGAYMLHPPFRLSKSVVWRPLTAQRYVVIASSAETVADPLRLLRERPLVRYDRSLWSGRIAENYLRQQRIRPNDRIELDALDAIAVLAHRGIGVSLVPDRALPWPGGLSIVRHALPEPAPQRELGLLWPVASAHARLIRVVERETILVLSGAARASERR
jgi:DNA-binding transcriptional LysR family regulator